MLCYAFAGSVGFSEHGPFQLPLISRLFYPDSLLVYLYPVPLVILGLLHSARTRNIQDHSHFLMIVTLSFTLVFAAAFGVAMALPFSPHSPKYQEGEEAEVDRPPTAKQLTFEDFSFEHRLEILVMDGKV